MSALIHHHRFLEEYAKYNLTFWAVTTGNEPSAGRMTNYRSGVFGVYWGFLDREIFAFALFLMLQESEDGLCHCSFQALGFTAEEQRDWVALDLGPALHASAYPHTHVLLLDDSRLLLPYWAKVVSAGTRRKSWEGCA